MLPSRINHNQLGESAAALTRCSEEGGGTERLRVCYCNLIRPVLHGPGITAACRCCRCCRCCGACSSAHASLSLLMFAFKLHFRKTALSCCCASPMSQLQHFNILKKVYIEVEVPARTVSNAKLGVCTTTHILNGDTFSPPSNHCVDCNADHICCYSCHYCCPLCFFSTFYLSSLFSPVPSSSIN